MRYFLDLIPCFWMERGGEKMNDSTEKRTLRRTTWRSFQMKGLLTWPLSGWDELAVNIQHCAHTTNQGATKWPAWAVMCHQCLYMANNGAQHEHRSSSAAFSSFIARQQKKNARPKMAIIGDLPPLTLITVYFLQGQRDSEAFALRHLTALLWRSKVLLHHLVWNISAWWHKT